MSSSIDQYIEKAISINSDNFSNQQLEKISNNNTSILTEATRSLILQMSKQSDNYVNNTINRYKRRIKSRVSTSITEYDSIDMNKFFKTDMLTLGIKVKGETDTYSVKITLGNILKYLLEQLTLNNQTLKIDIKYLIKAISTSLDRDDLYTSCSCPDWRYRIAYFATKHGISNVLETRPSNITNPNDTKGEGCKHVMLVLANSSWKMKLAICIKNYVDYIEKHKSNLYQSIIFPKLYGKTFAEYEEEQQELQLDNADISSANEWKKNSTRFQKGNTQGIRFASKAQIDALKKEKEEQEKHSDNSEDSST